MLQFLHTMGDVQRGKRCKFPRGRRLRSMILVFKSSKGKALIFVCLLFWKAIDAEQGSNDTRWPLILTDI